MVSTHRVVSNPQGYVHYSSESATSPVRSFQTHKGTSITRLADPTGVRRPHTGQSPRIPRRSQRTPIRRCRPSHHNPLRSVVRCWIARPRLRVVHCCRSLLESSKKQRTATYSSSTSRTATVTVLSASSLPSVTRPLSSAFFSDLMSDADTSICILSGPRRRVGLRSPICRTRLDQQPPNHGQSTRVQPRGSTRKTHRNLRQSC